MQAWSTAAELAGAGFSGSWWSSEDLTGAQAKRAASEGTWWPAAALAGSRVVAAGWSGAQSKGPGSFDAGLVGGCGEGVSAAGARSAGA